MTRKTMPELEASGMVQESMGEDDPRFVRSSALLNQSPPGILEFQNFITKKTIQE